MACRFPATLGTTRVPRPAMTGRKGLVMGVGLALAGLVSMGAAAQGTAPAAFGSLVSQIAGFFPALTAEVVEVKAQEVIVSVGSREGAQAGMELSLFREGRELRLPKTGEVLGRVEEELGVAVISKVFDRYSVATVASGAGIQPGDRARISGGKMNLTVTALGSPGVSPGVVEAVFQELAEELSATGRFQVISGDGLAAAVVQARIPPERVIQGEGLAEAAGRYRVGHLLVLWVKSVQAKPFVEARLFSFLPGREPTPMLAAGLFAPSSAKAPSPTVAREQFPATPPPFVTSALPREAPPYVKPAPAGEVPVEGPSFLVKGDQRGARSADEGPQDHLIFEVAEPLVAIAAGDLDGDGRTEIVGITEREVIVYRWENRRPVPIARSGQGERFTRYLHLDVADVNGSERAQVFVTALSSVPEGLRIRNSLHSFILELRGGTLVRIAENLDYFLRVLTGPGIDAPLLIAQRMGEQVPFVGPIIRLRWTGERYAQAEPLRAPGKGLYDFAPLSVAGGQVGEAVAITDKGRVRSYGPRGETLWESRDALGEVDHLGFFQTPAAPRFVHGIRAGIPADPEEFSERIVLPRRVLVEAPPLWGDATVEVLTLANVARYGLLAVGEELAQRGRIVAFDRRDGSFIKGWETVPVEGKVRDVAIARLDSASGRELVVLSATAGAGGAAGEGPAIINVFSFTR